MKVLEFSGKNVEEALANALKELDVPKDRVDFEVVEEGSKGLLGLFGAKPAMIRVTVKKTAIDEAKRFLGGVLDAMEIVADIEVKEEAEILKINLSGPKMGLIIGYRGETLDSLQYLTSLVVNKGNEYKRVILDTEGYRMKREETLKRLADKTAYKVRKYGRSMKLEPMNPYERRIIHSSLQGADKIKTYSIGDEPFRRVVVELEK
ncbi:MAG TPA: RNA-binding cell elongation regulator Jag/EloR [Clostridiaceae bacterium]|nr:RNA-binding cell elongation regulator Jag/EloR [Clostridiaceae bacterium]